MRDRDVSDVAFTACACARSVALPSTGVSDSCLLRCRISRIALRYNVLSELLAYYRR